MDYRRGSTTWIISMIFIFAGYSPTVWCQLALSSLANGGVCDTGQESCDTITVFGQNFINGSQCQLHQYTYVLGTTQVLSAGTPTLQPADYVNDTTVTCSLSTVAPYIVRITNDGGTTFTSGALYLPVNMTCHTCTIPSMLTVICNINPSFCYIRDRCMMLGATHPQDSCKLCMPAQDPTSWSRNTTCAPPPKKGLRKDHMIIIIVVILVAVILIGLVCCFICWKRRKRNVVKTGNPNPNHSLRAYKEYEAHGGNKPRKFGLFNSSSNSGKTEYRNGMTVSEPAYSGVTPHVNYNYIPNSNGITPRSNLATGTNMDAIRNMAAGHHAGNNVRVNKNMAAGHHMGNNVRVNNMAARNHIGGIGNNLVVTNPAGPENIGYVPEYDNRPVSAHFSPTDMANNYSNSFENDYAAIGTTIDGMNTYSSGPTGFPAGVPSGSYSPRVNINPQGIYGGGGRNVHNPRTGQHVTTLDVNRTEEKESSWEFDHEFGSYASVF